METNKTSNGMMLPVVFHGYCDFGHCTVACAKRCTIDNGCWDGRPVHFYREAWKLFQARAKAARELKAARRKKPQQQEMFA